MRYETVKTNGSGKSAVAEYAHAGEHDAEVIFPAPEWSAPSGKSASLLRPENLAASEFGTKAVELLTPAEAYAHEVHVERVAGATAVKKRGRGRVFLALAVLLVV